MGAFFIAGAGTDIGKTYVTAALARRIRARGGAVRVLKPVVSGVPALDDPAFAASDTAILLAAAGLPVDQAHVEACSPWRFAAALAPDRAAAAEGRDPGLAEVMGWCRARLADAAPDETMLIEGAGGLMSPLTREATVLDWLVALDCPVILVAGSYLGAISHALTAIEVIRARRVPLHAVVVSESLDSAGLSETVDALVRFAPGVPIVPLGRGETGLAGLTEP
ncbi:MAG TPA: dethiobiotin synthase [Caulobacteraceae bacterium]|jgi:dethiobiotin synthetase|nr:dethiobiotin synthase [Caulobacteraceae bacterium]